MMLRRWALHLILALALVIGQQGAVLHALSHFAPESPAQEQKHAPGGEACEKCAAYAKFGSALPVAGVAPAAPLLDAAPVLAAASPTLSRLLLSPPARGPPVLL